MVDEAHALGCVGARGHGSFEHFGIDPSDVDIWMGTLSKTLSATGGYIAGSATLIEFLKNHADGFVFSVALPPALAAAAECALQILRAEPDRAARLHDNSRYFLDRARALGLDTGLGQGYAVAPVMIGDSAVATKLSERLLGCAINVAPVTFPGVPMQMARLRFFLSCDHTHDQIDAALVATRAELDKLRAEGFGAKLHDLLTQLHGPRH
jgi:7-keto-8-aminopelargonate synthetase-like enzyme